jgi:hypothetical protein
MLYVEVIKEATALSVNVRKLKLSEPLWRFPEPEVRFLSLTIHTKIELS